MATYRNVQLSFWTDSKITDEFTPEDKYFYLYLLTNPHTNTSGCYEISIRLMSIESGYSQETVERLIERFTTVHNIIRYSKANKELLLINWRKYNWTTSEKLRVSIFNSIKTIKTKAFKDFLMRCYENINIEDDIDMLPEEDTPIDRVSEQEDTPIDTMFSLVSDSLGIGNVSREKKQKEIKHEYGEYKHVRLTDSQYAKLINDYGEDAVQSGIRNVDEYCQEHGKVYKDYNLTLRKWGIKTEKIQSSPPTVGKQVKRELQ